MDKRKRRLLCMLEGSGRKNRWISGVPPLSFRAKRAGRLSDYRIYGNTVGGESVGDRTGNLFDGIEPFSNVNTDAKMQLDIWFRFYPASDSYSSVAAAAAANNAQIGQHIIRTITPQEGYERLVVKHNGSSKDIIIISQILEVEKTYTVSFDITKNDVQIVSGVIISNIQIEENSQATDYEPYGYRVPVEINDYTVTLYLPKPLKMVGDEAEYIDYAEQKMHRIGADDIDVTLPALPTLPGTNVLSVGTAVQPSRVEVKGRIKAVGQETEPEPEAAEPEQE